MNLRPDELDWLRANGFDDPELDTPERDSGLAFYRQSFRGQTMLLDYQMRKLRDEILNTGPLRGLKRFAFFVAKRLP